MPVDLHEMDMVAATRSLKDLGYENSQDERAPERSVQFFSHLFRDTGSVENAKKESKEFFEQRKRQKEQDTELGVREKGGRKMKKIPDSFMFVMRVIGLLRGLCATLEVELPLIEILASHARIANEEGDVRE